MVERRTVRPIGPEDAEDVGRVYETSDVSELRRRMSPAGCPPGTVYYALDSGGEIAAVFGLTELGRLRTAAPRRLLLHEFKLGARFRGTNVLDEVLDWLASGKSVGKDVEAIVFTPTGQLPEAFARQGLVPFMDALKWEVP